uniref:hypothetical protein n=1 Tax=Altererythrobacter segetis TaxID=1104773 RepID=UPI00140D7EF4|nr:hypothetical protein [Altererythrobacter segetis]
MRLQFFRIEPGNDPVMFIAARNEPHCAEIFVTWDTASGRPHQEFSTERFYRQLPPDMRIGLDDMLNAGIWGIADYDPLFGWHVRPPE